MQVRNEKARRFLLNMRKKPGVSFEAHFPRADAGALSLLRRMLAFDPAGQLLQSCSLMDLTSRGRACCGAGTGSSYSTTRHFSIMADRWPVQMPLCGFSQLST